ncbi:MAG TPA: hypothetical protein V6D06_12135 [Trichocoleus sp.]
MLNNLQQRLSQHQLLSQLRIKLLRLHQLLLDTERISYERVRGQITRGELLQLAIGHAQFAWLHQLSRLIVQFDDLLEADEPATPEVVAALVGNVRTLLVPDELGSDFAVKYDAAFQQSPDVVLAHADVMGLLPAA